MNITKLFSYLFPVLLASYANATLVLIDDSTRNGGFEAGIAAPWGGVSVMQDASFAHEGEWYGEVSGTRGDVFQFIPISNTDGHDFLFSFWSRVPEVDAFSGLSISFTESGFSQTAAVTPINEPSLSSQEWRFFSYSLETPFNWNDSGNSKISILFPNSPGTRFAYLDQVTFVQIPEPSAAVLLFALMALASVFSRRREKIK
jgi:hypothetical protein